MRRSGVTHGSSSADIHAVGRRLLSRFLLAAGLSLLLVAGVSYGWMSLEQRHLAAKARAESAQPNGSNAESVTFLRIPRIDVQAAILEGTERTSLLLAPGHLQNTAWPGDPGNAVIAAHRDTFFHRLDELNPGDPIFIRSRGREYRYVVTDRAIVLPNDVSVTNPTSDTRLTLITCYPNDYVGPAPKRLVVVAKLDAAEKNAVMVAAGKP